MFERDFIAQEVCHPFLKFFLIHSFIIVEFLELHTAK